MAALSTFFRSTPSKLLSLYFARADISLPGSIDWNAPEPEVARSLLRQVDEMDHASHARLDLDVDRVHRLADEGGQTALYGVIAERDVLDELATNYARSLWVFLDRPEAFRHAEEVRYIDQNRRSRMWDGFVGTPGLGIKRDPEALDAFKTALREKFDVENVHVDVFDRHRSTFGEKDRLVVQTTVYREGRPDASLEFVDGALNHHSRKPVYEAAITYEPETGAIEVVASNREIREGLVRLYARVLLGAELGDDRLPVRRYSLAGLMRPRNFPTDVADAIDSVRVTALRLMPLDASGERVTLECPRKAGQNIWQMADQRFGHASPLGSGWVATQAKLSIYFHPPKGARRIRVLPLIITLPHACDLRDRTEHERLIGSKYLHRWGLLEDV